MAKFRYKFEAIKKIKENLEKKVQKEISVIDLEINRLSNKRLDVLNQKARARQECFSKNSFRVFELKFQEQLEQVLETEAEKISLSIRELEENRKVKVAELTEKSRENKIFETLKEKHYEDFLFEENQIEQKEIDEIASKQYSREG